MSIQVAVLQQLGMRRRKEMAILNARREVFGGGGRGPGALGTLGNRAFKSEERVLLSI